ncbi:MAG: DUF1800 domain-containing protein [Terracidiphilus sp.]|jgi:uncharacterized protein (DUF1800 family)
MKLSHAAMYGPVHEAASKTVAAVLCSILCFPAPMGLAQEAEGGQAPTRAKHRQEYASGELQGDERILHALERFTFGPKPGDVEAVKKMGLDKWFDEQLHSAAIDEADLNARLAQYPAMQWGTQDLMYRMPSNAMIRMAADGKIEIPQTGTLHAVYENQIYRFQLRKQAQAEKLAATTASGGNAASLGMNGAASGEPAATSANEGADKSMDASGGMALPSQVPESGPGAPAVAGEANAMAPADANRAPVRDEADEAQIRWTLALAPEDRVRRLQNMRPEEFESFMKSLKPAQRAALVANMSPDLKESVEDLEHPEQTVVQELFAERLARDIYSKAQLQEVMTDFWLNHFNIYLRKNEQMPSYLVSYERDTIRPHALGKFEDLLEAVAHSPAMMIYLDNAQSVGPDSPAAGRMKMAEARRPNAKRQDPPGINENYARELMELHTVGVNGGYTQADVIQVARVLTGWGVNRPQFGGGFEFNENRHEPGTKKVMGVKIKENGEMEGRELLHFLATRPATAQFISRQLAIRFVSDDPPQALMDRMAKAYMASDGDIPTVLKTLFHSPEFWAKTDDRAKVKTPIEFVVSAVRASNADVENYLPVVNQLRQMGMPLYGCIPPVGYKWDEADWVSTGALVDRMNFALALAANRLPGITVEWAPELDMSALDSDAPAEQVVPTPESEEARLEQVLLPGGVSATTRAAALQEFEKQNAQNGAMETPVVARRANRAPAADAYERENQLLAGLLMGSPEFQRR